MAVEEVPLADIPDMGLQPNRAVLAIDEALQRLEKADPLKGQLIEMRYFGGMTAEESAEAMGQSVHVVRHEIRLAHAWLRRELAPRLQPARARVGAVILVSSLLIVGAEALGTVGWLRPAPLLVVMALVIALAVGALLGVGCYCAGPVVASTVSGLAGFAGSLIASAIQALRRMLASGELNIG